MNYIDGFVAAVPTANKPVYSRHRQEMGAVFKEHRALAVVDAICGGFQTIAHSSSRGQGGFSGPSPRR